MSTPEGAAIRYTVAMGRNPRTAAALLATLLLALLPAGLGACATIEGARFYGRGTEALERGDARGAITNLERAADLVPHGSEIHNHLGIAYAAEGRDGDALRAFRRAVALDCDNAAAQRNLRAAEAQLAAGAPLAR